MSTAQKRAVALGIQVSFIPNGGTENILKDYYFKSISKGATVIEQFDMTHLMTESVYREFMGLMADPGDVTLSAFYDPSKEPPDISDNSDTIRENVSDGVLALSYRQGGSQVTFFTCNANLQEFGGFSAEAGQMIMGDTKFKMTGKPTFGTTP